MIEHTGKYVEEMYTELNSLTVEKTEPVHDNVNHPAHYTKHPSGVECITITQHMGFNLGNALKYIWRCDLKKDAIEDLKKAIWYIDAEISKRGNDSRSA